MKRTGTISFLVVMAVVVLGLVFLSSGPAAWATSNQSPAAQATTTPAPSGVTTVQVTSAAEAKVQTDDGKTEVKIPAGSVTETVEVTLTQKTAADAPAAAPAQTAIVDAFTIEVSKGGVKQATFTFSNAIEISSKVTQADMAKVNNDVAKIRIMRYAADTNSWVPLQTSVDLVTLKASATVRSLSFFALAVTGQVATATPTPVIGPVGDAYLSGSSGWWVGLVVLGLFMVLFGGAAIRRQANKRNM